MSDWEKIFKTKGRYFLRPNIEIVKLLPVLKKAEVEKILDLGCGSGRHVVFLTKRGFNLYGFDISASGIRLTRKWLREVKMRANLRVGDIYGRLPYKTGFFDAVISILVIHHGRIGQIRKTIKEIRRVLRPGGLAFVTVTEGFKYKKLLVRGRDFKVIAPFTYVPLVDNEAGTPHYIYNPARLKNDFKSFEILRLYKDKHKHYCILAKK